MKYVVLCAEDCSARAGLQVVGWGCGSNYLLIHFIGLFSKTNSQQVRFTLKRLVQGSHHSYHK